MTHEQENFLRGYMPANHFFTSNNEISEVSNVLSLRNMGNDELREIRNSVVKFYSEEHDKCTDRNKRYDLCTAMMSVTAIIDHVRVNKNFEV